MERWHDRLEESVWNLRAKASHFGYLLLFPISFIESKSELLDEVVQEYVKNLSKQAEKKKKDAESSEDEGDAD